MIWLAWGAASHASPLTDLGPGCPSILPGELGFCSYPRLPQQPRPGPAPPLVPGVGSWPFAPLQGPMPELPVPGVGVLVGSPARGRFWAAWGRGGVPGGRLGGAFARRGRCGARRAPRGRSLRRAGRGPRPDALRRASGADAGGGGGRAPAGGSGSAHGPARGRRRFPARGARPVPALARRGRSAASRQRGWRLREPWSQRPPASRPPSWSSPSPAVVVLFIQGSGSKEWREFGRTEVIDNTLNPDFVRKFVLDYFFEEKQNLRFDVYNVDSKSCNISKHDFLGQAFVALGEVIGSQWSRLERPLTGVPGKKCGTILLSAEELSNCRDIVTMQLCANKLDKKDFFGKSDPFLVFYRSNEDGTFTICHKTEVVKNTLNPVWQPFSIPVRALCNGDYDRTVKIDVYDWDRDGSHDFIGEFATSYRELSRAQSQFTVYEVLNPKKKCKKKKYINSGTVTLLSFAVESEFSFVDYIRGGTQLNFTVAIDFTASNGVPSQPTSLHYMSPYQLSAYAMALKAVGEIIQDYDSDKLFPAYGFGAKVPPDGSISHQFPLNSDVENPSCVGIDGVLESYFQSLRTVQLYGPTNFAPVINQVARLAAQVTDGSQYYVLLIVTDGVISDMLQTKEAIINASALPMSIIIVGVGPAEFDAMEELDGDDVRVSSRGRYAERDIVQFVPFRDYVDRSGNQVLSMARLAKDVLAEIPEQLLSYMKSHDIKPRPTNPQ
ncbi:copine-9 isoform X2 [Dermochelys coriacea]|uniref:copine-9 isoform X2 n=1 Tax=Dermochelys coriacea TaxID=27794 RepID=UPI001CA80B27|nr:copine-9 isoform X2 [Dermochelys coriacea]